MRMERLRRLALVGLAPAAFLLAGASIAGAQSYYPNDNASNPMIIDTFDNATSFTNITTNSGPGAWYNVWTPPPPNQRFDYGGPSTTNHHSTAWSDGSVPGGYDATAATGGPANQGTPGDTGGSLKLSQTFNNAAFGPESSANTLDVYFSDVVGAGGQLPTGISFDVLVDPASVAGNVANGYGYFQLFTRDDSYNVNGTSDLFVNGSDVGGGMNLGDPTYGGVSDAGTWDHVYAPLSGVNQVIRGLTFQDYNNGAITGNVTYYLDNIQIYVPEPASFGVLGLGIPALLARRRTRKA
jgi:hypothetical protein